MPGFHPDREDFAPEEIVARAAREALVAERRPGVYVHIIQHCVANRPPNPGRYRMLYETRHGYRRLFRAGDPAIPARAGSKITPQAKDIPSRYASLLTWYQEWSRNAPAHEDPLIALYGSGTEVWASEHADAYVARLREGWE